MSGNYSRLNRYEKRRRNTRLISVLLVVAVILILVLIGNGLFGGKGDDDEASSTGNESSPVTATDEEENEEENKEENKEDESNEKNENDENDENEENEANQDDDQDKDKEKADPSDDNVSEAYTSDWDPVGTEQTGEHTTQFEKGSQDWQEMEQAASSATGINESEMVTWWIEGVDEQETMATVSNSDETETYRVFLSWVEGEGWQPQKVEVLKENDKKN